MTLDALLAKLHGLDADPSPEDVADILWLLATARGSGPALPTSQAPAEVRTPQNPPEAEPSPADETPRPSSDEPSSDKPAVHEEELASVDVSTAPPPSRSGGGNESAGHERLVDWVGGARALPNPAAFVRALRPLKGRVKSLRKTVLDEEATARRVAEERLFLPKFVPARSRWLDLALIVDDAPSMAVWGPTVREFVALVRSLGAFDSVRVYRLDTSQSDQLRLLSESGGSELALGDPSDPQGRRAVLLVTDASAPAWYGEPLKEMLRRLAVRQPLALALILPSWQWGRTALAGVDALRARALRRGERAAGLTYRALSPRFRRPPNGLPIPVFSLTAPGAEGWGKTLAGLGGGEIGAVLLDSLGNRPSPDADDVSPGERLAAFHARASGPARRLATLFAATPLQMGVMRVIAEAVPEADLGHLAEVVGGGLMRHLESSGEETWFEFHDGVRDLLLETADPAESLKAFRMSSRLLEQRDPAAFPLRVVFEEGGPEAEGDTPFGRFARLGRRLLRWEGQALPESDPPKILPVGYATILCSDSDPAARSECESLVATLVSLGWRAEASFEGVPREFVRDRMAEALRRSEASPTLFLFRGGIEAESPSGLWGLGLECSDGPLPLDELLRAYDVQRHQTLLLGLDASGAGHRVSGFPEFPLPVLLSWRREQHGARRRNSLTFSLTQAFRSGAGGGGAEMSLRDLIDAFGRFPFREDARIVAGARDSGWPPLAKYAESYKPGLLAGTVVHWVGDRPPTSLFAHLGVELSLYQSEDEVVLPSMGPGVTLVLTPVGPKESETAQERLEAIRSITRDVPFSPLLFTAPFPAQAGGTLFEVDDLNGLVVTLQRKLVEEPLSVDWPDVVVFPEARLCSVAWTPDGSELVAGGHGMGFYDPQKGVSWSFDGDDFPIEAIAGDSERIVGRSGLRLRLKQRASEKYEWSPFLPGVESRYRSLVDRVLNDYGVAGAHYPIPFAGGAVLAHDSERASSLALSHNRRAAMVGRDDGCVDFALHLRLQSEVMRQEIHRQPVRAVALSPDGTWYASASGSAVGVGTTDNPLLSATYLPQVDEVVALSFSGDGELLAVLEKGGRVRLWSVGDWRLRETFVVEPVGEKGSMAFHPSLSWLAIAEGGGTRVSISKLAPEAFRDITQPPTFALVASPSQAAMANALRRDLANFGVRLEAVSTDARTFAAPDTAQGTLVLARRSSDAPFSADDARWLDRPRSQLFLVAIGTDGSDTLAFPALEGIPPIHIDAKVGDDGYDAELAKLAARLLDARKPQRAVVEVSLSGFLPTSGVWASDGSKFMLAGGSSVIQIAADGSIEPFPLERSEYLTSDLKITAIDCGPEGVILGDASGDLVLFPPSPFPGVTLSRLHTRIEDVSLGRSRVVVCTRGGGTRAYSLRGSFAQEAHYPREGAICVVANPKDERFAIGFDDGTVVVWVGKEPQRLKLHSDPVNAMSWNRAGNQLVTASSFEAVVLTNALQPGKFERLIHSQHVIGVAFSSDDRVLATLDLAGTVRIWDCEGWTLRESFETERMGFYGGLSFHPTEARIAVYSDRSPRVHFLSLDLNRLLSTPAD